MYLQINDIFYRSFIGIHAFLSIYKTNEAFIGSYRRCLNNMAGQVKPFNHLLIILICKQIKINFRSCSKLWGN